MRADEVTGSELARLTLRGSTTRIHEFHQGIADRAFDAIGPAGRPSGPPTTPSPGSPTASVRLALGAGARAVGAVAALRADGARWTTPAPAGRRWRSSTARTATWSSGRRRPRPRDDGPGGRPARAGRAGRPGRGRSPTPPAGSPSSCTASPRPRHSWGYRAEQHYGRAGVTYGTRLRDDLGLTPVYLRYNTGLHISDNGRSLDDLLAALVDAWPVPCRTSS